MQIEDPAGRRVRLVTRGMAYGPHAVAHLDGKVVFVRGAAPDEEVEAVIREDRRTYAYAEALAVVRPSAQRVAAPCPYLPRCGGCPWQHLAYPAQLEWKRDIVREHLRRLGGVDVAVEPVLPSPRELAYRRRIKLRVADGAVGYYAGATHALVAIEHCLLGEAAVDAAIGAATELVRALCARARRVELLGRGADGTQVVVAAEIEGGWQSGDEAVCRGWLEAHPTVSGLVLRGRGWRRTWGATQIDASVDPRPLTVHAPGFTQVNPGANRLLVETVLRLAAPLRERRVLDCFAGAGNLSLALREAGARVVAVEQDRQACADAEANAAARSGAPLHVVRARAERAVAELARAGDRFDVIVLDPPRSGAAGCVPALLTLAAPRLIYVSCDPATLARDLRALSPGYAVEAVQPIDMFPHTYHVETVVRATRRAGSAP